MRAFVVGTGRCGTLTVARALTYLDNYKVTHESRNQLVRGRLDYPNAHVEVDNRLSWFLGSLIRSYPEAIYVHLTRDPEKVARSYAKRMGVRGGIMPAFSSGVVFRRPANRDDALEVARLYVRTVTDNVDLLLDQLPPDRRLTFAIEEPHDGFDDLWRRLYGEGDLDAAHRELGKVHNASR